MLRTVLIVMALGWMVLAWGPAGAREMPPFPPANSSDPADVALYLFDRSPVVQVEAIRWFRTRGERDAAPALIRALRFNREGPVAIELHRALADLTGEAETTWFDWVLWQQKAEDLRPFAGHDRFLATYMSWIDPQFRLFLQPGIAHEIRLEEILWGGVRKDGIPALVNPARIPAGSADYLNADDLVFGVEINGDARAYPLRILDWHEMFNDVIGGVPVALAYCTLCGSGILFETAVEGQPAPFEFGSSGFLYRSNKLMYDRQTHSLWNQFTGRPVVGPLTGSGLALRVRPVVITTWGDWRAAHPQTTVLSLDTGHERDYGPGAAYAEYFASPDLMFPARVDDTRLAAKDFVFALRGDGAAKAWPLDLFAGGAVLNDTAGILPVVLIGDAATRTVRAYRREEHEFARLSGATVAAADGTHWQVTEEALVAPDGRRLDRLPGHIAYWFAWSGYLGAQGALATP